MCHPDGTIAFFNEAALGTAAQPNDIDTYAGRCGLTPVTAPAEPVHHNIDSGYIRLTQGDCVVLLDVAALGPSDLPRHSHPDTLSFEMSIGRTRLVVNGVIAQQGTRTPRQAQASTAAHNTVEVDGENSSQIEDGSRGRRRANVFDLQIDRRPDEVVIACSHDGYRLLPGRPVHRRTWILGAGCLRIIDAIKGGEHQAIVRFHLGPDVLPRVEESARSGTLTADIRTITCRCSLPMRLEPSAWHLEFGLKFLTTTLVAQTTDGSIETEFSW
jgi:uncharacterized heparinase superfamily protein